jgi:hypothetical protein
VKTMLRWWRKRTDDVDALTHGADGRPLDREQDRQAEAIRVVLRRAGFQEFSEEHGGFVIEPSDATS